ncbi:MAG TPA: cupin domain-containing protein [Solimonas sp.]|nr:cupin domain-containing protein [Solimonas sp.]
MTDTKPPVAIVAADVALRTLASNYPEPFASRMSGRGKRPLGEAFGLRNFGVNLTQLQPGAVSALHHCHSRQDELIYILQGYPTLVTGAGEETPLEPGMCAGFRAATGEAHHLVNRSNELVVYLEVGDRTRGDAVTYPDDDLASVIGPDGGWHFAHKDGRSY